MLEGIPRLPVLQPALDLYGTRFGAGHRCVHLQIVGAMGMDQGELCPCLAQGAVLTLHLPLLKYVEGTVNADEQGGQSAKQPCAFLQPLGLDQYMLGHHVVARPRQGGDGLVHP